jgi:hypothetical protein
MRFLDIRTSLKAPAIAAALLCGQSLAQQDITFSGGASMSFGRIEQSSDTSSFHYTGNRLQTVGAQLLMTAHFGENLITSAGLGITERHYPSGSIGNNGGRTPFVWSPYLVNADFNYAFWNHEGSKLALTGGYFPYTYNPDVKNLGLYLLRGPVYPGILISGFETKYTRPVANTLGFRLQQIYGGFEQNFIVSSETESYPLFDISPAYIASYSFGPAFKIGGGVNLYHKIAIDHRLTSPDTFAYDGSDHPDNFSTPAYSRSWIYLDSVTHDTTFLSFAGTKVMANAVFDPKPLFNSEALGPEDLRLYGEIAVIGLDMSAAYKSVYGGYKQRMPIMGGFNFPTFRYLDHLSLEVEWYGSKIRDDLARFQATTGSYNSPLPVANTAGLNLTRDDWKWSVHAQKTVGQVRFSVQVANDHSRSGGTLTSPGSEWETYYVTPKDWYWMAKAGFFF